MNNILLFLYLWTYSLILCMAFESNSRTAHTGRPDESISSSSLDDTSTTIHRTRSQRIASLPLRYLDSDNRSVSSSTHSTQSQRNPAMSQKISDKIIVSALGSVCNIYQALNNRKPGRFCSSCDYFFHLSCCRPKLTQLSRLAYLFDTVNQVSCQLYASNEDPPVSQLRLNQESSTNSGTSLPNLAILKK